ncbi:MAG: hypothetical protein V3V18_09930 [Methylococcales bacterium]
MIRIVETSEPWVLYTTDETEPLSTKDTKLYSAFMIEPHYLTNISQPELNHRIDARIGLSTTVGFGQPIPSLKKIVRSHEKLVYTSLVANNDEATSGVIKLMSEPLQGTSAEIPAAQLAEGVWEVNLGPPDQKIPNFIMTPDERWVIQSNEKNNESSSFFQNRWISLKNKNIFFDTTLTGLPEFTPATDRLLVYEPVDSGLENVASLLGYDLMRIPGDEFGSSSLPDNCKIVNKFRLLGSDHCDRPWTELWWNPSLSGQGISTQQRGDRVQATWYIYDKEGEPLWLDFSGKLVNNQLTAPLLRFTGPGLGSDWDNLQIKSEQIGTATMTLGDDKLSATNTATSHASSD